jgi:hypothetical protein
MTNIKWTQADIDKLLEKGIRQVSIPGTNPGIRETIPAKNETKPASFALGRMKAGKMNKTETAYAGHLEALKMAGEVVWYAFEPMNLKLADKCFYRVDFLVMVKSGQLEVHEVKGGYITDDSLVKVKTAAEKFPFRFIMVQLKKGKWEVREF